jgi:dTDP-4-amino-4,6-dideoxygalactose transaminase
MEIAEKHNLLVVEDAAQAIDSYYKGRPLGTIGHLSAFSFHETKNVISGEGGMLGVNDERFIRRAEIIWEKGTNRAEFFRGEVNKYGWCDIGSSFLPSEVVAAFLWAQLESLDDIQARRKLLWNKYYELLNPLANQGRFSLPDIPDYATNNAHMFYLVCRSLEERTSLISYLKSHEALAVFHYLSLHKSEYYLNNNGPKLDLPYCDRFADCLVRLPMYFDLTDDDVTYVISLIHNFYLSL